MQSVYHIDFEEWSKLAKRDPETFESLRTRMLESCIAQASKGRQERLRCLQWRINQVRNTASNPMAACISISDMMWETFTDLGQAYRNLETRRGREKENSAKILPFKPGKQ